MDDDEIQPELLGRRRFLATCSVFVVGGCFSGVNLRKVLAASQQSGKPILTDAEFNARLASLQGKPAFRSEIAAIKDNLFVYFDSRYSLTEEQQATIAGLPPEQELELNENLDRALQQHLAVKLQIRASPFCQQLRLTFDFTPQALLITASA